MCLASRRAFAATEHEKKKTNREDYLSDFDVNNTCEFSIEQEFFEIGLNKKQKNS
jgi:hypothetical protein